MRSRGNETVHLPDKCERLQQNIESKRVDTPRSNTWLDDEDRAHLLECSECAGFVSLLQMISEQSPVVDKKVQHHVIDSVNDLYFIKHKRSKRIFKAVGVVASVAAILLAVLWFGRPATNPVKTVNSETPLAVERRSSTSTLKRVIKSGSIDEFWQGAARLSLAEGGDASVIKESSSELAIRVESGLVAVRFDSNRRESSILRVEAGDVQVKVTGTIFAVERHLDAVRVDVLRGSVECLYGAHSAESIEITVGQSWRTANQKLTQLDHERALRIEALLKLPTDSKTSYTSSAKHQATPVKKMPSKVSLLAEARRCRIQKDWKCAEHSYTQLQGYYPKSAEAITSLISLAQLRLNKLGKPQKALAQFRFYLKAKPSGPLAEEAVYGMSLAYKTLGRRDDERKVLQKFVREYPKSQLYKEANRRLDKLSQ